MIFRLVSGWEEEEEEETASTVVLEWRDSAQYAKEVMDPS